MTPSEVENSIFFWRAMTFLSAGLGMAATVTSMIATMRRKPPLSEELYKDFATKAELIQLRTEFLNSSGEIFNILRRLNDSLSSLKHAVGRVEGALEQRGLNIHGRLEEGEN